MSVRMVEMSIYRSQELVGRASLGPGTYTIGRVEGCHIMLPDVEIGRAHV